MRGSSAMARASAVRCFWPPDRVMPRSPRSWHTPAENQPHLCRAARRPRLPARHGPGRLPGATPPPARTPRCRRACPRRGTVPAGRTRWRHAASGSGMSRTSTPSMNTVPGRGSCSRGSRLISVDLPEPVAPTRATVWPGSMTAEMPSRTAPAVVRECHVAELDAPGDRRCPPGLKVGRYIVRIQDRGLLCRGRRSIRFHEARPRCIMLVTQPNAIIGHASMTRYALNATSSPMRDAALDDLAAALPQHEQRAEAEKERHARIEHPLQPDQPAVAPHVLLVRPPEPLELRGLLSVGSDDPYARRALPGRPR